jgi:alkaline phosphatase
MAARRAATLTLGIGLISGLAAVLTACSGTDTAPTQAQQVPALPAVQREHPGYRQGLAHLATRPAPQAERRVARNVILFVGDGMGVSTVSAARILDGQRRGMSGEENSLSFERFPHTALAKTYNTDAQTADSAGTMSAIMTGVKTRMGMFGVDGQAERGNCASGRGRELVTLLELAEAAGRATGVVSTARLTHATPAATLTRSVERDWEDDSELTAEARANGCRDIARQIVDAAASMRERLGVASIDGPEVLLGGGRANFLPLPEGRRGDGADLVAEWLARYPDGAFVETRADLLGTAADRRLLGLFGASHMSYEQDRPDSEPSLAEMTSKAIEVLERRGTGYFLMVEGGRIDHAHHAGNAAAALRDTIAMAEAVQTAVDSSSAADTLILVTADHSHTLTFAGYPRRGNPILGTVVAPGSSEPTLAADGQPYTTLGYRNGLGFRNRGDETDADGSYALPVRAGRADLTGVDTTAPGFHQEALVPLASETHGGEDVAVYARGPGAHRVAGTIEQNVIFHIMAAAAGLLPE